MPVPVDDLLDDGAEVRVGHVRLGVVHLVGHTPGSVALVYDDPEGHPHLFTGDSLFPGGPGRTTRPEDFTSLMNDLEAKIFGVLPDDDVVLPGAREGLDARCGAPGAAGVARARLVAGRAAVSRCGPAGLGPAPRRP